MKSPDIPERVVSCPACKAPVPWVTSNPYRPFCSRRCQDSDFLHWARDEHRIPGQDNPWPEHDTD